VRRAAITLLAVLWVLAPVALPATALPATALPTAAAPLPSSTAAGVDTVSIAADQVRVDTAVGGRFTIRTVLVNDGARPSGPLIAHLNVASLTPDVYVDPEDWSSQRTQRVDSLGPRQRTQLTWRLQAVNAGTFDVYVVLLPTGPAAAADRLTVSRSVHLNVAGRQTLSAGGVLPVVIAVPALLGLLVMIRERLRRSRTIAPRP
jgi:hypothetical protein